MNPTKYFSEFLDKTRLSIEQLDKTNEQQIINKCLILYEKEYHTKKFKDRKDFKYLYAPNLEVASESLFQNCEIEMMWCPSLQEVG